VFGCTAAITLQRAGYKVSLFERNNRMCLEATAVNQFRLHEGYHYPRSPETVAECQRGLKSFRKEYDVIDNGSHYYAIAKHGSKTSPRAFTSFCHRNGLDYDGALFPTFLDHSNISLCVQVHEGRLNPDALRHQIATSLRKLNVEVNLFCPATCAIRREYDHVIVAAYASTNAVMMELGCDVEEFQYEVVEKPVLRLPREMEKFGVVIMDGSFCSLDPFAHTGLHVMGHVNHAIHHSNTGFAPTVPPHLTPFLSHKIHRNPKHTKIRKFLEAGQKFIPALKDAIHVGSMYTIRIVLPDKDATDERPTVVTEVDPKVVRILSGKIGTAVTASQDVLSILRKRDGFVLTEETQVTV